MLSFKNIFFHIFAFVQRNFISLIFVTLFNYIYSIEIIDSVNLFLIRQVLFLVTLILVDCYRYKLASIAMEDSIIQRTLTLEYPILRFHLAFGVISFLIFFVGSNYVGLDEQQKALLIFFGSIFAYIFATLTLLRIYVIINTPSLFEYYNIVKSIRNNGFRSFSTSTKFFHLCKGCAYAVGTAAVCDMATARMIEGTVYGRGFGENFLSSTFGRHHLKAHTYTVLDETNNILDNVPEKDRGKIRANLLDKDGFVDHFKVNEYYKNNPDMSRPRGMFDSKVSVEHSWRSPWSRRGR